ncbi:MAG: T9SS type A sorting domain-containing protein [bacterium]|nr:T9SS type A sorting domain-containing protein [bacterium]
MRNFYRILTICLSASNLHSTTWMRTFDGGGSAVGRAVVVTRDSCYIAAGYADTGTGNDNGLLLKVNKDGVFLWSKTFGGSGNDSIYSMDTTFDGGCILTGAYSSSSGKDIWLVKVNAEGDTVWTKTFNTAPTKNECGYCVRQTIDSGYIITGFNYDSSANLVLLKTNANGDSLWAKKFGRTWQDYGYGVCEIPGSGYMVVGSFNSSNYFWILKTDINGDTLWTKQLSPSYSGDKGTCIQRTTDGNYIISGKSNYNYPRLLKINGNGSILWTKNFNYYSEGTYVDIDKDNGYVMVTLNAQIVKTNNAGIFNWGNELISSGYYGNYSYCVHTTPDNGYIVTGGTSLYGSSDLWLMRIDPGTGVEEISNIKYHNTKLEIEKNPFVNSTIISYSLPSNVGSASGGFSLAIYDIAGKIVKSFPLSANRSSASGGSTVTWNAQGLSSGIYFAKLIAGNITETKKIVLMR